MCSKRFFQAGILTPPFLSADFLMRSLVSACALRGSWLVIAKPRTRLKTWQGEIPPIKKAASLQLETSGRAQVPKRVWAQVTLVAPTLDSRFVTTLPQRLIGDRAYDADPLDEALLELGIEMIAAHRRGLKRPKTQDGRPLRHYKRRWKVERLFAELSQLPPPGGTL